MYRHNLCYGDLKPENILFKTYTRNPNLIGISIGDIGSENISSFRNPFLIQRGDTGALCRDATRTQTLDYFLVMFAASMFNWGVYTKIDNMLEKLEGKRLNKAQRDSALLFSKLQIERNMPHFLYLADSWGVLRRSNFVSGHLVRPILPWLRPILLQWRKI